MKKFGYKAKLLNNYNNSNSSTQIAYSDYTENSLEDLNIKKNNINLLSSKNPNFKSDSFKIIKNNENKNNFRDFSIKEEDFEFKKSSKRILISEKNATTKTKFPNENFYNNSNINYNNNLINNNFNQPKNFLTEIENINPLKNNKNNSKKTKLYNLDELQKNNLYSILNVKENASKEEIKKSYRELSKIYHPDKGGCAEDFLNLNRAYKILMHDTWKNLYDQFSIESFSMIDIILKEDE